MNQSILKSSISCLVEPQPSQPSGTKRTAIDSNLRQFDTKWPSKVAKIRLWIYIYRYIYHISTTNPTYPLIHFSRLIPTTYVSWGPCISYRSCNYPVVSLYFHNMLLPFMFHSSITLHHWTLRSVGRTHPAFPAASSGFQRLLPCILRHHDVKFSSIWDLHSQGLSRQNSGRNRNAQQRPRTRSYMLWKVWAHPALRPTSK